MKLKIDITENSVSDILIVRMRDKIVVEFFLLEEEEKRVGTTVQLDLTLSQAQLLLNELERMENEQ